MSTSAGIPGRYIFLKFDFQSRKYPKRGHLPFNFIKDFRGPKGVWTLEKKGLKPEISVSWDDAKPTKTHMGIKALCEKVTIFDYLLTIQHMNFDASFLYHSRN